MAILDRILVPIASEDDATATCDALRPYLASVEHVTALHVIEKGGGAIDKAPMEKRRADATEFLATVETQCADSVDVDTRIAFGTDIVETVFEVATASNATAIVVRPRGGSRILQLLSGDTAARLVSDPEFPVVSLPDPAKD